MRLRVLSAVVLLAGMTIGPARAQVLRGSDFQVNVYTNGSQAYTAMAPTVGDAFVVAWGSQFQDGSRVNTYTTGNQSRPAVAARPTATS